MARRGPQQIIFICIGISDVGELLSKEIAAASQADAASLFLKESGVHAKNIHGPFYKKRTQVLETTRSLKFTNVVKKAEYNGWLVNAIMLSEPANQAYLIFLSKNDGTNAPKPKGTIVVPISNLRIINNV